MKPVAKIAIVGLGVLAAAVVFLGVKWLMADSQRPNLAGKADTRITMQLALKQKNQVQREKMTLVCGGGLPRAGTGGFTMDIQSVADRACRLAPRVLYTGDFRCKGETQDNPGPLGWGSAEGVVNGRKVSAQYSADSSKGCEKQYTAWKEFSRLWLASPKPDPKGKAEAKQGRQQSLKKSKELDRKFEEGKRELKQRIAKQNKENQRYLAPDVKINR